VVYNHCDAPDQQVTAAGITKGVFNTDLRFKT